MNKEIQTQKKNSSTEKRKSFNEYYNFNHFIF